MNYFISFELGDYPNSHSFFTFQPVLQIQQKRNNIIFDHDIMILQSSFSSFTRPISLAVKQINEYETLGSNYFINTLKYFENNNNYYKI